MNIYLFFRLNEETLEEFFYPIPLKDNKDAIANAHCNPGTIKVVNAITEEVVWENLKN